MFRKPLKINIAEECIFHLFQSAALATKGKEASGCPVREFLMELMEPRFWKFVRSYYPSENHFPQRYFRLSKPVTSRITYQISVLLVAYK